MRLFLFQMKYLVSRLYVGKLIQLNKGRFCNTISSVALVHTSIFFRYKHIPSLRNLPSPAPNESLPYWFQGNFAASFVFNFCFREFLLSAFANRFELRCEPKRLMLLYYKICPCYSTSNEIRNFSGNTFHKHFLVPSVISIFLLEDPD